MPWIATTVSAIILGRHVDPTYLPSRGLLDAVADTIFDPTRCGLDKPTDG